MSIQIHEIGPDQLHCYEQVPVAFEVKSVLDVQALDSGLGGLLLCQRPVEPGYIKDYDADYEGERPSDWPELFDVRNWAFFLALKGEQPMGAAAVAFDTPGVHMLGGRRDLAVL